MNFTLRHLRYFAAAAERGSISAAAASLHVSQPSVAAAINHLEREMGVALFLRRQAHGVTATRAGAMLYVRARNLLDHADDFGAYATDISQAVTGEINVACFVNIAPVYMAGITRSFQDLYPGVRIRTHVCDQQQIFDGIGGGAYELALTFDLGLSEEYRIDVIGELPPQIVVSADHRLAECEKVSLEEIVDEPFIYLDLPHSREYFLSLFTEARLRPRQTIPMASFETIRTFVGNGLGYSILNLKPRNARNYDGTLVRYLATARAMRPLRLCCLQPIRTRPRRAVEAFVEHIHNFFGA